MPPTGVSSCGLAGRAEARPKRSDCPRNNWFGALLLVLLAGCAPAGSEHHATFAVFGTEVELKLRGASDDQAARAFRDVGALLQRQHRELHPWEDGELMALNRALAAGAPHRTTSEIAELIETSGSLEEATGGAFNPAVGALVNLWGFHTSNYPITEPPPAPERVDALVGQAPSMRDLEIEGQIVRTRNPAVRLDFSGIAKGLAVKRVCEIVAALEIQSAMVNAGGDVMVCSAGKRPWRVAVRAPGGGVLETHEVDRALAVFTSGNYYRYGEFDGQRYAHILDPISGYPVDEVVQATVIDPDPLVADAAATALIAAGTERWQHIADALHVEYAVGIGLGEQVLRLGKEPSDRQ